MSIEARYRGALRVYPAEWRARNEQAALGILLDSAEAEGRESPDLRETISLVANGLVARLDQLMPPRSRDLAALSALLGTTGFALIDFVFFEWEPWSHAHRYPHLGVLWQTLPFSTPAVFTVIAWLVGAMFWFCGVRATARVFFALSALASIALAVVAMHPSFSALLPHLNSSSGANTCCVFIVGTAFVLLGDPDRLVRPARQLGLSVAVGLALLGLWRAADQPQTLMFTYWRRDDDELWRGWMTNYVVTADYSRMAVCLAVFFVVLAISIGLGSRRVARTMVAVLGQLAAVATCFLLVSQSGPRFVDLAAALLAIALGHAAFATRSLLDRLPQRFRPVA